MRTVSALFDTYDEVTAAVDRLSDMGVSTNDITIVTQSHNQAMEVAEGAGIGAAIGGVGGVLAGFVAFALPGMGSLLGIGWLVPILVGAAAGGVAGGVVGSLTGAGISETDAHVLAESVRRGSTLVMARVHEDEVRRAMAILTQCGAIDTNARRVEYESDGWESFVASDIWDKDIGTEDDGADRDDPERDMSSKAV